MLEVVPAEIQLLRKTAPGRAEDYIVLIFA
jgi:hypothetical protein